MEENYNFKQLFLKSYEKKVPSLRFKLLCPSSVILYKGSPFRDNIAAMSEYRTQVTKEK